jgi:hypothetical protein
VPAPEQRYDIAPMTAPVCQPGPALLEVAGAFLLDWLADDMDQGGHQTSAGLLRKLDDELLRDAQRRVQGCPRPVTTQVYPE